MKKVVAPVPDAPPDPMGLGRDEDTIGNVRALVPKQPVPDQAKLELCAPAGCRCPVRQKFCAQTFMHARCSTSWHLL